MQYPGFQHIPLDAKHGLWQGALPSALLPDAAQFEALWALHPAHPHTILIHGKALPTPRWEQAYNHSYLYSGYVNQALPVPEALLPLWQWAQTTLDARLNGMMMTWYDGRLGHYIGKHRDSTQNMVSGAPIITVSLGQSRLFRLRPLKGKGYQDFPLDHGTVCILPYATNLAWTHEVPAFRKWQGRRIAITLRAFHSSPHPSHEQPV